MGLATEIDASRQSASRYVYVTCQTTDTRVKIRCSDHDDRYCDSDWHAWAGECPSVTVAHLARHFGQDVPAGYRPEDFAARSAAAKSAGAIRAQAQRGTETEMIATIIATLRAGKSISALAAGKAADALYPTIPRAQRQRVTHAAAYTASRL